MRCIVFIVFSLCAYYNLAQEQTCEKVYGLEQLSQEPKFINDLRAQSDYFFENLLPILVENGSGEPLSSFHLKFVLDKNGRVLEILNLRGQYSDAVKEKLLKEMQKGVHWAPGMIKGSPVCSECYFVVSCILWD